MAPKDNKPQSKPDQARVLLVKGVKDSRAKSDAPYGAITFRGICEQASNPSCKEKGEAQAIIPSTYRGPDGRNHAAQRTKGNFIFVVGDVDTGNHSVVKVVGGIREIFGRVEAIIYSTASAEPKNRRWRYIVLLENPVAGKDYELLAEACAELMWEQGIECDRSLERAGQISYLPNVPRGYRDNDGKPRFYKSKTIKGKPFQLEGSVIQKRVDMLRKRQTAFAESKNHTRKSRSGEESLPINGFNQAANLEELFVKYGYEQSPRSPKDWRSPYQESGSYATRMDGDYWVSLSGSDADNSVGAVSKSGYRFGDAFDLYCHFEHGGDYSAAIRALKFGQPPKPLSLGSLVTTMTKKIIQKKPKPREMICRYFPVAATSAIVAMGGVGKTTWLVRTTLEFMKDDPEVEVMIVSGEDGPEDYQAKVHNLLYSTTPTGRRFLEATLNDVQDRFHVMDMKGIGAKMVADQNGSFVPSPFSSELALTLKEDYPRVRLVVFETVSRFAGGEDNERMEALVTACDRVALAINGASACVHHTGKGQGRDKIIDLYSGRGGSTLGDNTRCMVVMTRLDNEYPGEKLVLPNPEDMQAGRVFEVKHVRNSYGPVLDFEYYVIRSGCCHGPVLEPLQEAADKDVIKARLAAIDAKRKGAATQIFNIVKQKGKVARKFFDIGTKNLIGVTQAEGREIIKEMLASGGLMEQEEKKGRTISKILEAGQWT